MCLLFYQGAWQLVLHPAQGGDGNAHTLANLPAAPVHFDVDATGRPQLSGWRIPSVLPSRGVAIYLRGGDASLQTSTADATDIHALHDSAFDVLTFDYRGYGSSAAGHPSQERMQADADAAYAYAVDDLKTDAAHIVLAGEGLGAVLAANVAHAHGSAPALIVFDGDASAYERVRHDPRGRILPVALLFHDRFDLAAALAATATPKLLISAGPDAPERQAAYAGAASPKRVVSLTAIDASQYTSAIDRFSDEYMPAHR